MWEMISESPVKRKMNGAGQRGKPVSTVPLSRWVTALGNWGSIPLGTL